MNRTRNPDLNLHERFMCFMKTKEIEDLRILERAKPGTSLYAFKLE